MNPNMNILHIKALENPVRVRDGHFNTENAINLLIGKRRARVLVGVDAVFDEKWWTSVAHVFVRAQGPSPLMPVVQWSDGMMRRIFNAQAQLLSMVGDGTIVATKSDKAVLMRRALSEDEVANLGLVNRPEHPAEIDIKPGEVTSLPVPEPEFVPLRLVK